MQKLLYKVFRVPLLFGLHSMWWTGLAMSLVVGFVAHWHGIGAYSTPCVGRCAGLFGQTQAQAADLASWGFSLDMYDGVVVGLSILRAVSSMTIALLLYGYGRRDFYCVIASLLIMVTGVTFTADPAHLNSALKQMFAYLDIIGSMYVFFLYLYPDGKFTPRWTAVPAVLWVVMMVLHNWAASGTVLDYYTWTPALRNLFVVSMHALVIVMLAIRARMQLTAAQKRHFRWLVIGIGLYALTGLTATASALTQSGILRMLTVVGLNFSGLIVIIAICMSLLENRVRSMSIAFNRTMVYIFLSFLFVVVYAMLVGVFSRMFQGQLNALAAMLVTGLAALAFQPLRLRVQRAVNHLVYGERDDPYQVLSKLTERLEGSLTQKTLLPAMLGNIAHVLQLPYVAVEVQSEGSWRTLAAHGSRVGPVRTIPLVVQGEIVGHLQLGVEHEEDGWAPGTPRLLEDLIRQVSIAVQAVHLIEALRRSREKLVNAREEERRRLRRDLHDGLGSGLASMRLRLDLAVMMMENEPAKAQGLMHEVQAQLVESIADIRRLVYALRPPALDEFGLVFALKELAMQYEGLDVIVEAPRGHLTLYAGAEVAIYRIVQEAVNNTSKHAFATTCRVRLSVGEEIELEIADDGQGMPERIQAGVGLHSMKERAEELGGKYDIQSTAGQGTVVRVRLPMEREDEGDGNQRERHPAGVAGR